MSSDDPSDKPAGAELLWSRSSATRRRRTSLDLDRIVTAAIALVDGEGLEALSMQRLARQLDAAPMSLYRHITAKDELVALMLDTVLGEPPKLPKEDWVAALETWAGAQMEVFRRHPWLLQVVGMDRSVGPNEAAWGEVAFQSLSYTRFPPESVYATVMSVNAFTRGAAQVEVNADGQHDRGPKLHPDVVVRYAPDQFPATMRVIEAAPTAELFEYGLRSLLAGLRSSLDAAR